MIRISSYFEAVRDLLFPSFCLGCRQQLPTKFCPPLFCSDCLVKIQYIRSPCCRRCGQPFPGGSDHLCSDCLRDHLVFDLARSVFLYQDPIASLILSLKFGGCLSSLNSLRILALQATAQSNFSEPDLILPVPLHIQRLRQRGFNQALLIARSCFPQWKHKITADLLKRSRPTIPQSVLSGKVRRENLEQAFMLAHPEQVDGKHILLVDDVYTTGSTVNECSKILRANGAVRIEIFTLARSVY